jgi:hypothetical protein
MLLNIKVGSCVKRNINVEGSKNKQTLWLVVHKQTIPTDQLPLSVK